MSGAEGLGEMMTGGMLARAVEPHAGEPPAAHGGECLNCRTSLIGDFCHRCGQTGHVHRSLGAFFHDLLHGVLHFEGKIWRTLPMLAWRPGHLTRRYIAGERARYVSPMALFLFSVFAMFAIFSAVGGPFATDVDPTEFRNTRAEISSALASEQRNLRELIEARQRAVERGNAERVARRDQEIAEKRQAIQALQGVLRTAPNSQFVGGFNTGWAKLDKGVEKLNENPTLALYKVQTNAYKFSWLLIPLSVPFVWLLFPFRRGVHLYDHTVFVTYSLSFMTLLMVVLALMRALGVSDGWIGSAFAFVPPIHMFLQLKGAYGLRWWSAALRAFTLAIFACVALALFLAALIVLGALG